MGRAGGASRALRIATSAIVFLQAAIWAGLGAALYAATLASFPVKIAPISISVTSDGATPEQIADLTAHAWDWFDRDTRASTLRVDRTLSLVVDLGAVTPLTELRLHGNEAARLSVDADSGTGSWVNVAEWNALDARSFDASSWTRISSGGHATTQRLRLTFTPKSTSSSVVGIDEIELWGSRAYQDFSSLKSLSTAARANALPYPYSSFAAMPSTLAASDAFGAEAKLDLERDARQWAKAWLVYDVAGATGGIGVQRSWNGLPLRGGFQRDTVTPGAWTPVIEEIDPEWLKAGVNTFDIRPVDNRTVAVRNLQLVTMAEDGRNDIASIVHDGTDGSELRDGDPSTAWTLTSSSASTLTVSFVRTVELDSLSVDVPAARRGNATWEALVGGNWVSVPTSGVLNTGNWQPGWNTLSASAPLHTTATRLRFAMSEPGLQIGELSVSDSAIGARYGTPRIVIRSPENGEYWNDTGYVWGWVVPNVVNGQVASSITIASTASSRDLDGAFARTVDRSEADVGATGDGPWEIAVRATLSDGTPLVTYVEFGTNHETDVPQPNGGSNSPGGSGGTPVASSGNGHGHHGGGSGGGNPGHGLGHVTPTGGGHVQSGLCVADIPPGAVSQEMDVTIDQLAPSDLAGLGPALVNVTGPPAGCRFLPHGHFNKPIKIEVPYERALLPDPESEDELTSYYYDADVHQWLSLSVDHVNKGQEVVVSQTDHFTDVINGVLVLPDHPSPLSYNPNTIKDLKAATPAANIDLIQPPVGGVDGAANVGFPIRVPPGRGGATPSLSVRYSSGNADGPMGLGWRLSTSSISIDTRFGVPRYDGHELYTLDGSQLERMGTSGALFRERIEGAFLKIERLGDSPSDFSWVVTGKDGSKAIYGQDPEARLADPEAPGNIFEWFLEETIAPNGNTVRYSYLRDDQLAAGVASGSSPVQKASASVAVGGGGGGGGGGGPGGGGGGGGSGGPGPTDRLAGQPWVQLYLQDVNYSGHDNGSGSDDLAPSYHVHLDYDTGSRTDLMIDCRAGFKTLTRLTLLDLVVSFQSQQIRKYLFDYITGAFSKTLLASVAVQGTDGSEFYRHQFHYFDKPTDQSGAFAPFAPVAEFTNAESDPPLNQTESTTKAGSLFVGVSAAPSRQTAIGLRIGKDVTTDKGDWSLVDVNGDGRPDEVQPGSVRLNNGHGFEDPSSVVGLSSLEKHDESSISAGIEGPGFSYTFTTGKNDAKRIFTDANGDGFVDVMESGHLYANRPDLNGGRPTFGAADAPENPGVFAVTDSASQADLQQRVFEIDPISVWVAPFDGTVAVSGPVRQVNGPNNTTIARHGLLPHPFADMTASVVLQSGEFADGETLWSRGLSSDPVAPVDFQGAPLSVTVHAGNRLYFRVHATGDLRDSTVSWNPAVSYQCVGAPDQCNLPDFSAVDISGHNQFVYDHATDFDVSGWGAEDFSPTDKGTLHIVGELHKDVATTHPVTFEIRKHIEGQTGTLLFSQTFAPGVVATNNSFDRTFDVEPVIFEGGGNDGQEVISFSVVSAGDVPFPSDAVSFQGDVFYDTVCRKGLSGGGGHSLPTTTATLSKENLFGSEQCQPVDPTDPDRVFQRFQAERQIPEWTPGLPQRSIVVDTAGTYHLQGTIELQQDGAPGQGTLRVFGVNRPLLSEPFSIAGGAGQPAVISNVVLDTSENLVKGDRIFVRVEADAEPGFSTPSLVVSDVKLSRNENDVQTVPVQVFSPAGKPDYPQVFEGGEHQWWSVGWNGNKQFKLTDIDKQPDTANENDENSGADPQPYAVMPQRFPAVEGTAAAWTMGAARVESDQVVPGRADASADGWFEAPDAFQSGHTRALGLSFAGTLGLFFTDTQGRLDLFDFNGDRIPDLVRPGAVQFRGPDGAPAFSASLSDGAPVRQSEGVSFSLNIGPGGPQGARAKSTGLPDPPPPPKPGDTEQFVLSGGLGLSYGLSATTTDWQDVNGDGLPDRVYRFPGTTTIDVQLNLGYRLGAVEHWTAPAFPLEHVFEAYKDQFKDVATIVAPGAKVATADLQAASNALDSAVLRSDNTLAASLSAGFAVNDDFGAGFTVTGTFSADRVCVDMVDVNGDGLPDIVEKLPNENVLHVMLNVGGAWQAVPDWNIPADWGTNLGDYFASLANSVGLGTPHWPTSDVDLLAVDSLRYTGNLSATYAGFASIGIPILPPPFGPEFWLFIAPAFSHTDAVSGLSLSFQDLDGDGLPDYFFKEQSGFLGGAGGEPFVRWKKNVVGPTNLLKEVDRPLGGDFVMQYERAPNTIGDPLAQWTLTQVDVHDGRGDDYTTTFAYANGFYDRAEREFLGFGSVITRDAVGREVDQTYDVSSYYHKGLLLSTVTRGVPQALSLRGDQISKIAIADPTGPVWTRTENTYEDRTLSPLSRFPQRTRSVASFYEGTTTNADALAPKSLEEDFSYDDVGNLATYANLGESGPQDDYHATIEYKSDDGSYRVGLPTHIAVTDAGATLLRERRATYDAHGNLQTLTSTVAGGQSPVSQLTWDSLGNLVRFVDPVGYTVQYSYDPTVRSYVESISDSFGYTSTATHDFRFGLPLVNTDINGQRTSYVYDVFGRTTAIFGPREFGGPTPAVASSYFLGNSTEPPNAVTKNKEDLSGSGTLDTLTIIDGLGRVLQTQVEADVAQGSGGQKAYGVIVSGKVIYDGAGRVTAQEQPTFVAGWQGHFVGASGGRPTLFTFDPLDRTTRVTLPDGSVTQTTYDFSEGLHRTTVVDAENRKRVSLADVRGNVTAIDEFLGAASIRTRYAYSPLSELASVTDAKGNRTTIDYDTLGRRTRFFNPDRGRIDYSYDPSGNLVQLVDDDLRAAGKAITYRYDFDRLAEVNYPSSPHTVYAYGGPNAPHNQAGRIATVTDESGSETRFYGVLGDLEQSTRMINSLRGPSPTGPYTTKYLYDDFGRMRELTYPDGEVLTYEYDHGGRVVSATGKKGETYHYLNDVAYDAFGSRVRLALGNGVTTTYAYDPNRRWLTNLRTVTPHGTAIQDLGYKFDRVGNILELDDSGVHPGKQLFSYDTLDRLIDAQGQAQLQNGSTQSYVNAFQYDVIHNLVQKVQHDEIQENGGAVTVQHDTTYTLNCAYQSPKPHALTTDGEKTYSFDPNGNMQGWQSLHDGTRRTIAWDEENRIREIDDNGNATRFLYDAGGQRAVKEGKYGEVATVNAFYTAKNGEVFTKHVFVGDTRIASKVEQKGGNGGGGGGQPGASGAPAVVGGTLVASLDTARATGTDNALTRGNGRKVGLDQRNGITPPPPPGAANGSGGGAGGNGGPLEKRIFFYHPDHLGSASYLTGADGTVFERLAYFPYGEMWIDEGNERGAGLTFRFTGKELDPETGLYYLGARYLDPRSGEFLAFDPMTVANPGRIGNPQAYARWNPLRFVDPTGLDDTDPQNSSFARRVTDPNALEDLQGGLSESDYGRLRGASAADVDQWKKRGVHPILKQAQTGLVVGVSLASPAAGGATELSEAYEGVDLNGNHISATSRVGHAAMAGFSFYAAFSWLKGKLGFGGAAREAAATEDELPELSSLSKGGGNVAARDMMREAIANVLASGKDAAGKAAMFEQYAGQISGATKGAWTATRAVGTDGSAVFVGEAGEALVISPQGEIFRGSLQSGGIRAAGAAAFDVNYSILRPVK